MADSPARRGDDTGTAARHVESERAFDDLLASEGTVLVDFYADWCGPCRMMESIVEELAAEEDTTVAKVDVDALSPVAARYEVKSIPAFVVFEGGEPTDRLVGMQELSDLRRAIE
ncbi:thioredoxin [Halosimplex carlsbadense 2-9-1]|uniref:Thioredoxin n=1 Tax=Halosimplex carlsbadense 2-9-1 TaxID=797114 RepID=M0CCY5_9EURY|nr:thioredoxin family protein [Halosimplex carlsbadense]ELZ21100.1 thioredoxin [Halosimplex carlsbadense 2-9-1]